MNFSLSNQKFKLGKITSYAKSSLPYHFKLNHNCYKSQIKEIHINSFYLFSLHYLMDY